MTSVTISKGTTIYEENSPLNSIDVISDGIVKMIYPSGELIFEKGDCLGLIDLNFGMHSYTYIAVEDTVVTNFPCGDYEALKALLATNEAFSEMILASIIRKMCNLLDNHLLIEFECDELYTYIINSYDEYKSLCEKYKAPVKTLPGLEKIAPLNPESKTFAWLSAYYDSAKKIFTDAHTLPIAKHIDFIIGFLMKASIDMMSSLQTCQVLQKYITDLSFLLINEQHMDYLDLYFSLLLHAQKDDADTMKITSTISKLTIHIEGIRSIDKDLYSQRLAAYMPVLKNEKNIEDAPEQEQQIPSLAGSLDIILSYSGCQEATTTAFREAVAQYKALSDKNAWDDTIRKLRKTIQKLFYEIYFSAFKSSLSDQQIPTILNMFFKFGYIDEELAGSKNAAYLYTIADSYTGNRTLSIYTVYEWLLAIYHGEKEPSRNEFDVDYTGYVRELKTSGKINAAAEQELLHNKLDKGLFELQNMFPQTNKMTFGNISTFCPIFSEHNVLKSLESSLTTSDKIWEAMEEIRSIDYSAFYREVLYSNPDIGVPKEYIQEEVLPDILLMPNVGSRGVMWQEIEGMRRNSPARMVFPIFSIEEIKPLLTRMTAEFRWEMCKRIQGAHWNDPTAPSLTSEYYDYLQFFRTNNDLSLETKNKVKQALQRAKNNFKEVFIQDYILFILYEGTGSARLNKLARKIITTYCPLSTKAKTALGNHPAFNDIIHRQDLKQQKTLHRLHNLFQKINNSGHPVPEELERQIAFWEQ